MQELASYKALPTSRKSSGNSPSPVKKKRKPAFIRWLTKKRKKKKSIFGNDNK